MLPKCVNNQHKKKKKYKLTKRMQTIKIKIVIFYDPPVQLSPGTIQFPDRPNISKDFMKLLSSHPISTGGSSITLYLKKTWKTSPFSCLPFFYVVHLVFKEWGRRATRVFPFPRDTNQARRPCFRVTR